MWYLFCCLYSHNVAPEDKFIALVTTKAETDDPEIKLKPGVDLLGPVDDVFYETLDRFEPRDDGAADSCFVSTASRRIRIICGLYLVIKPITIASSPLHTSEKCCSMGCGNPMNLKDGEESYQECQESFTNHGLTITAVCSKIELVLPFVLTGHTPQTDPRSPS
ncbi:uncharacterized protein LOC110913405 [Helianthus annuus]|uniref:uncharacterized protein LOC110910987 n=1 Tax=Helianthus annuus TaxID=4232 RepID=UPI001653028D|nr:uncharacterized protein LOC110910987 [Helianthus annuus]XP_035840518.1 uncharacterized protein LOC110913405 [Helianthus annuus]